MSISNGEITRANDSWFDFEGPRVPWNKALNALDFHHRKYRYFTLKEKPTRERSFKINKSGHIARKTYEEVQELIQNEIDDITSLYLKDNTKLQTTIKKKIDTYRDEAIKLEEQIYSKFVQKQLKLEQSYSNFIRNTQEMNNVSMTGNYDTMSTIELWTRIANNATGLDGQDLLNNNFYFNNKQQACELALARILSSAEIYKLLQKNTQQSFFSRTSALKGTEFEKLGDRLSWDALEKLTEDMNQAVLGETSQYFKFDQTLDNFMQQAANSLRDIIYKAFLESMGTYYNIQKGNIGINTRRLNKIKKLPSAMAVSSHIRTKIGNAIDDWIDENITDEAMKRSFGKSFSMSIYNNDELYFVATSIKYNRSDFVEKSIQTLAELKEKSHTTTQQEFSRYMSENKKAQIVIMDAIFSELARTIREMNNRTLDLKSLGTLTVQDFIQRCYVGEQRCFLTIQDFYNGAAAVSSLGKNGLQSFFSSTHYNENLWKMFNIANNNQYISGFLGELSALYDIGQILGKGRITGSYNTVLGQGDLKHSGGESVNDLRYNIQNGKKDAKGRQRSTAIGANVKHYISSDTSLTLYPSKNEAGLSIFSSGMIKYLGQDDTDILRFVAENSKYFNSIQTIENISTTIANYHLPEFYRAFDRARGTVTNAFYELNNVIYPLSYIYDCVLKRIEEISLLEVKTVGSLQNNVTEYPNLAIAREKWKDSDWHLRNKQIGSVNTTIKTTGLKINLVQLNLFK